MRLLICTLTIWFSVSSLMAQSNPYENLPTAEPPYFRVRYAGSDQPGELVYPVSYTVWVPPGVKVLRGVVVHQHGCGVGSCSSGQTGAFDLHWQALAKKHECALLSPVYEQPEGADCQMWCDPRNGSDVAFRRSLVDLGKLSGHSELATAPWALWGHSGGGHWAGGMTLLHPDRTIAAWLRSGVPALTAVEGKPKPHLILPAAASVPLMCNLGVNEGVSDKEGRFAGVWPGVQTFFREMRKQGALAGISVDPLTSHECGNQRYLAIPWLDACLTARLPDHVGDPLSAMSADLAMVGSVDLDTAKFGSPVPANEYQGSKEASHWLPNAAVAQAWSQYVIDTAVADTTPPPAPTNLRVTGNQLTWEAEADLESGLGHFIIERDGEVLATVPTQPQNRFGRPLFQGLQYSDTPTQPLVGMEFTDTGAKVGTAHRYRVISVNTMGLKSP